jgi:photosystem II stability/assembly factor-like uncharacterized protein
MKNHLIVLTSLVLIFVCTSVSPAQWVQTNSLCGGYFASFAVSGTKIFAGAYGDGIFLSTNNGSSWTKLRLADGTWINALAISPNGTGGINLFVGATWGAVGEPNGVILSTDNGQSWTEVTSGLTNLNVTALAVLATETGGTNLFAATNGGGLFQSTNNGTSWIEADAGLGHPYITALTVSGTNLFAGTNYGGGVYRSTDYGTSWTLADTGMTNHNVTALAHSGDGSVLFAGTDGGGVFLSTNNGTYWTPASSGLTNTHIRAIAVSGANLFAGTDGSGVFLSTDNGTSWNPVNTGLNFPYVHAFGVVPNGTGGANIFAGTWGSGIFLSTNNGVNWTSVNSGLICRCVNTLAACDSNLFVGTNGCGAFISTDNGAGWTQVNGNLTGVNVYALAVVPNDQGGKNLVAGSGGVFLSSNNGASWILTTPDYLGGGGETAFAIDRSKPGITKIYTAHNALDHQLVNVFLSTDKGYTWTQFGVNLYPALSNISALAVSDTNLFIGTPDKGVLLTTDGGMNWTPRNHGLTDTCINALTVFTDSTGNVSIFAATNHGIFVTTDNGSHWSLASSDNVSTQARALAICRKDMFAGASFNVWKRPLSEMATAVEINGNNVLRQFSLHQNYPNPFNPSTVISYELPAHALVVLKLFDILGREVKTLCNEHQNAGSYSVRFDASRFPSGVYFYRLEAGLYHDIKKLLLLK